MFNVFEVNKEGLYPKGFKIAGPMNLDDATEFVRNHSFKYNSRADVWNYCMVPVGYDVVKRED